MSYSVLLVDDDPDVLRSLGDYLERQRFDVHRAESGRSGIAMWERFEPDVTVLDLRMPKRSGA